MLHRVLSFEMWSVRGLVRVIFAALHADHILQSKTRRNICAWPVSFWSPKGREGNSGALGAQEPTPDLDPDPPRGPSPNQDLVLLRC